jgi:hypothetical protein
MTVIRVYSFVSETGVYTSIGYQARLYKSSFSYNDTEVIYVPPETNVAVVAGQNVLADQPIDVPFEIRDIAVAYEDRIIMIPSNDNVEELEEYRQAVTRNRMRAT